MNRNQPAAVACRASAVLATALFACVCNPAHCAGVPQSEAYLAELDAWKKTRLAKLQGDTGFLNLVGLFWVRQDLSTLGSSADSDFVLPGSAAPTVGTIRRENDRLKMIVADGVDVFHDGLPVREIVMDDDLSDRPVVLTHGSLAWTVIRRDDRLALRVRDFNNPAIAAFKPIEYFAADLSFRVPARLQRFDEPRQLRVDTVIAGLDWRPLSPGILHFEIAGEPFELEAYESGDELFLVFADLSSGHETYPAGRFLYAPMPDESGVTILDFNKAYNPPCAFNAFATCPVASPRNRLRTRILAGERFDPSAHEPGSEN